jgi:hypothetical protein
MKKVGAAVTVFMTESPLPQTFLAGDDFIKFFAKQKPAGKWRLAKNIAIQFHQHSASKYSAKFAKFTT